MCVCLCLNSGTFIYFKCVYLKYFNIKMLLSGEDTSI